MRESTRKWARRAKQFLAMKKAKGEQAAIEWGRGFRRRGKLVAAVLAVQR